MSEDSAHRTHAIVSSLIRALTHRIRTPLSVISNELAALSPLLPTAELAPATERVSQITELLKSLSQFTVSPSPKQRIEAQEVVREISALHQEKLVVSEGKSELPLLGDRRMFSLALNSLVTLLLQLDSAPVPEPIAIRCSTSGDNKGALLFRSCSKTLLEGSQQQGWHSLSDFFNDGMDLDSFLPPCIDSILLAQGVTVLVVPRSGIEITLQFSLSE
ncbi:MAG: hypothetical protein J0M12_17730 [Deltaproteobacteria bacterium]|nr:hypothetical protein [Deltaproteobacteria bacterium]